MSLENFEKDKDGVEGTPAPEGSSSPSPEAAYESMEEGDEPAPFQMKENKVMKGDHAAGNYSPPSLVSNDYDESVTMEDLEEAKEILEGCEDLDIGDFDEADYESTDDGSGLSSCHEQHDSDSSPMHVHDETNSSDFEDLDGNEVQVEYISSFPLLQNKIEYACKFFVDPQYLEYYCTPENLNNPDTPVVYASPVFEGQLKSKWQVLLGIHTWVKTTRWISIYLSRVDTETNDAKEICSAFSQGYCRTYYGQCEFRIVDENRKILCNQKSAFKKFENHTTGGFTQFVPFKDGVKMLKDNWLHVEAVLNLSVNFCAPYLENTNVGLLINDDAAAVPPKPSPASTQLAIDAAPTAESGIAAAVSPGTSASQFQTDDDDDLYK